MKNSLYFPVPSPFIGWGKGHSDGVLSLWREVRRGVFLLLTFLLSLSVKAQGVDSTYLSSLDSVMQVQQMAQTLIQRYETLRLREEMQMSYEGTQSLMRGITLYFTERGYRERPAVFRPSDAHVNLIDYVPAATPLVAAWALRLSGIESRSTLRRMATSSAFSMALTAGLTCSLNAMVNESSPDESSSSSFVSSHAALAFASATILSREYGHYSPWVSVGGYACATTTQMLRIQHDKHWLNDVFMGAGIGILTTNFSYFLTDQIYGVDGINKIELRRHDILRTIRFMDNPTGLKILSGTEVGNRNADLYTEGAEAQIVTSAAFSTGIDFNFYLNPMFSIDAMFRAATSSVKLASVNGVAPDPLQSSVPVYEGDKIGIYHADVAAHFSMPLSPTVRMGFRTFFGVRHTTSCTFSPLPPHPSSFHLPSQTRPELGCGLDIELLSSHNYLVGITGDYSHTFNALFRNRYSISSFWKIFF